MIKRSLLALALVIGLALPANAAITRGVGPANGDVAGLSTSTFSLNGTTIGGMIVIVIGSASASGAITSITISGESDPTLVSAANFTANTDSFFVYYLANNTAGGNKTINVNFASAAFATIVAIEYLGQNPTSQPDATATPVIGSTGDPTISITTATTGDLIVSICSSNGGKPTMPSGYSDLSLSNPGYYTNAADNVGVGAPGSKTLIWTDVTNTSWGVNAVGFKAATVAGAGGSRHRVVQ